ncbi:MAG: hypothetical protein CLLPBCKN_001032 [Chroococcidiopsis cubana SAG 39.79]|nr:hypothetical protein [Chroococcidiopsis cubana SAG 39.79]
MNQTQVPVDRYVKVDSINTRYWMMGSGNPVILLHGVKVR